MHRNTRRDEPKRTELRLECTECEEEHSHIFYEPAPETVNVECPNCGGFHDHVVVGSARV